MKAIAGIASAVVVLPALLLAAAFGGAGDLTQPWSPSVQDAGIPRAMLALYEEAGARFGIPPGLLAAVGKVECDHNRNPACATPNHAGAVGPMQFLPTTFARWSAASGNPAPSILDPRDAVFAAAAKLAADGAANDPEQALFAYNHSAAYVAIVEAWALAYGWTPPTYAVLTRAVLAHPSIGLRPQARADVSSGAVDSRVLAVLLITATRHEMRYVGPFVSGHAYYVAGTDRPSNHAFGRAVDIPWVDGRAVTPDNAAARQAAEEPLALTGALRPSELGTPWADLVPLPGAFTDAAHQDHLHIGWSQ